MNAQAEKQEATFYELQICQADIDQGFLVCAYSSIGSRFKVLLFENAAGAWDLQEQVPPPPPHVLCALRTKCQAFFLHFAQPCVAISRVQNQ